MRNLINASDRTLEAATELPRPSKVPSERQFIARQRQKVQRERDLTRRVARAMKAQA